jgi:two-component system KDP operon response regulator KdpE
MAKSSTRILAIDDEPHILRFLQSNLQLANYAVLTATRGQEGLHMAMEAPPDLILLDLGLPDISGVEVLRQLRRKSDVPVIIITARDDEESMVVGLNQGADDYLIKPFSGRALQARIEAVLRRYRVVSPTLEQAHYQIGPLDVDIANRRVTLNNKPVSLTPIEFALLIELIRSGGRVRLHSDLLSTVWGPEYRDDVTVLRAAIYRLRHKIELDPSNPSFVRTESGVGYSFHGGDTAPTPLPQPAAEAQVPGQTQPIPQFAAFGDSPA